MILESIKLKQFKNHSDFFGQWLSGFNFIVGPNGVGKTNLLDAIYFSSMLKSYFQNSEKQMIQNDKDFYRIDAKFLENGQNYQFEAKSASNLRESKWEGSVIERSTDHIGRIPIIFISPDDIFYFFQESEERRKFLNQTIIQIDPIYMDHLMKYSKALKLRNALLKIFNPALDHSYLLDSYDNYLIESGSYISKKRAEICNLLDPIIIQFMAEISGGMQESTIEYKSQVDQNFGDLLLRNRTRDIFTQRTSVGVHKDQIEARLGKVSLREFGSQGQQKSFILALRLAQYKLISSIRKKSPIVLLDDVFAKLDESRVNNLLALLEQEKVEQCFITDTHLERVEKLKSQLSSTSSIINLNIT